MFNKEVLLKINDHLVGEELKYQNYAEKYSKHKNEYHDHCEFCGEKFSCNQEDLQWGYTTIKRNGYWWICPECFDELKDAFNWKVSQ